MLPHFPHCIEMYLYILTNIWDPTIPTPDRPPPPPEVVGLGEAISELAVPQVNITRHPSFS